MAAGALLAGVVPAGAAPSVTGLTVRPPYFTPNGDGVTDSTELVFVPEAVADSVQVVVEVRRVSDESLVATPRPSTTVPAGVALTTTWAPPSVAEGVYRFDIVVTEGVESIAASAEVVVDLTPPVVTLGVIAPNPFDPAAAAPYDSLRVPFTVIGDSTTGTVVRVRTAAGVLTDTLGSFPGSGPGEFTWDGKTSAGVLAAAGSYVVRAIAADLAGNADTTSQSIVVDRDNPFFPGLADTVQTDTMPFTLSGSAGDLDRVIAVETSVDGGVTYQPVDSLSAAGPAVTWSTLLDFAGATRGFFRARLHAYDAAGHVGSDSVVVAYDNVIPVPILSTVLGDVTVTDGGTVRIRTEWSLPGLRVTANFLPIDFSYKAGEEQVLEEPAGTYTITYRVSPANTHNPGAGEVVIHASTGIVAGQDTVLVQLQDAGPRGNELVAVSRNRFDPEANETVTIAADRLNKSVRVQVANLAGQIVRELEGAGWIEWDGRRADGGICASGVYYLRVVVDGDTENRRVAVMRGGAR